MSMRHDGRVAGKVAFVTGLARGMGRSHALRLAQEGADVVGLDVCEDMQTIPVSAGSDEDLQETVRLVHESGGRIVVRKGDVRSQADVDAAVRAGLDAFGHIDVIVANAGSCSYGRSWELSEQAWQTIIDINLTGVWHTVKAALPAMIEAQRGGSVILISSVAGLKGLTNISHYVASKHGVVGLARALANELGEYGIRANCICPGNTDTPLCRELTDAMFAPDGELPKHVAAGNPAEGVVASDIAAVFASMNPLGVGLLEPVDVSNAVLWLASDEGRYANGLVVPIDAGWVNM